MGILTNIIDAQQRDSQLTLQGKTLSRPQLLIGDGLGGNTYAVDVDIGVVTTQGYDQTQNLLQTDINGTVLHNVPLSNAGNQLVYAEAGSAVTLTRSSSGRYEVTGYAKTMPGTNVRIAVNLVDGTIGPVDDRTILARPLQYQELATFGGYGTVPYGAIAIFQGGVFVRFA